MSDRRAVGAKVCERGAGGGKGLGGRGGGRGRGEGCVVCGKGLNGKRR